MPPPIALPRGRGQGKPLGHSSSGIRAVDAPPPPRLPGVRSRALLGSAVTTVPNDAKKTSRESSKSSDVSPIMPLKSGRGRGKATEQEEKEDSVDESLWEVADTTKLSRNNSRRNVESMESADSSSRHKMRKRVGDAFKPKSKNHEPLQPVRLPPRPSARAHAARAHPAQNRPHDPVPRQHNQRHHQQLPKPPHVPPAKYGKKPPAHNSQSSDSDMSGSDSESEFVGGNGGGRPGRLAGKPGRLAGSNNSDSDDSSDGGSSDSGAAGGFAMGKPYYDPLEEETLKAVRKAKLFARMDQMEAKGIKRSKVYNYRSNEEELLVEVARMEVMAERSIRIEQGRAFLMSSVKATEKGAGFVDRKKWLPFAFNLSGFSKQIIKDIDKYDDCLERGVAETLGPASSRVWWIEMLWILIPAMAYYSMTNRMTENPAYANEVLRQNPEFQERLAKEVAKELATTEKQERGKLEIELRETRQKLDEMARERTMPLQSPLPSSSIPTSLMNPAPPRINKMQPPQTRQTVQQQQLAKVPSGNPLGDYPIDPQETAKMQAYIAQQQQVQQLQQGDLRHQVRTQVQQGLQDVQQTLLSDQKKAEVQRQKLIEQQLIREQQAAQAQEQRAAQKKQPTTRPRVPPTRPPPPPSKRAAPTSISGNTLQLNTGNTDDDDSSV